MLARTPEALGIALEAAVIRRITLLAAVALAALANAAPAQILYGTWGSGPNDVWIVGSNMITIHWDGQQLTQVRFGAPTDSINIDHALYAVWGAGPNDVFAVGEYGAAKRWNGTAWTALPAVPINWYSVELRGVTGRSASDVWAIGHQPMQGGRDVLLHFDGRAWTAHPFPFEVSLYSIAVTPTEVLVAGHAHRAGTPRTAPRAGLLGHWAGERWRFQGYDGSTVNDHTIGDLPLYAVKVHGSTVVVAGQRLDSQWTVLRSEAGGPWTDLGAPAIPQRPISYQGNGVMPGGRAFASASLTMAGDGALVAAFPGGYARFVNGQWTMVTAETVPPPPAGVTRLVQIAAFHYADGPAIWAPSGDDFWIAGQSSKITHVTGAQVQFVSFFECLTPSFSSWTRDDPACRALRQGPVTVVGGAAVVPQAAPTTKPAPQAAPAPAKPPEARAR